MAAKTESPVAKELSDLLGGLFDGDPRVTETAPAKRFDGPTAMATYVDNEQAMRYALVTDLAFANSAGAALSMIPPGFAADSTKEGQVPDNIRENLREVLNICVNIFSSQSKARVVLDQVLCPGDDTEFDASKLRADAADVITFEVAIPKYETGTVTLLTL